MSRCEILGPFQVVGNVASTPSVGRVMSSINRAQNSRFPKGTVNASFNARSTELEAVSSSRSRSMLTRPSSTRIVKIRFSKRIFMIFTGPRFHQRSQGFKGDQNLINRCIVNAEENQNQTKRKSQLRIKRNVVSKNLLTQH